MDSVSTKGKESHYKTKVPQHNGSAKTRLTNSEKPARAKIRLPRHSTNPLAWLAQRKNPAKAKIRGQASKRGSLALIMQMTAILVVACSLTGITGCTVPATEPKVVVNPELIKTTDIDATIQTTDLPADSVSPNGAYFLAVKDDARGSHLMIMPVDGEYTETVLVESVSKDWLTGSWFSFRPLGWTSDSEFVYAKVGWQPSGAHKSERGVALVTGSLPEESGKVELQTPPGNEGHAAQASTEEAAFFALPYRDSSLESLFLPHQNKVYLNNNTTIWQFDIAERNLTVLKEGLPDYIYRRPIPSPKGDYFVYELNEKGKSGVFIFDTATGEEKALLPNGDTMSFYPAWSFDGKYIATYTVGKKEGAMGTSWHDYLLFEGEDTAQSIGSSITIVDTKGIVVDTIRIEGKYLQNFRWSQNDYTIGFLAGSAQPSQSGENQALPWPVPGDSVWISQIGKSSKQPSVHLGDIPKDDNGNLPYTSLITFGPDSRGVFCSVYRNGTWYFSEEGQPAKAVDGLWPGWAGETAPVYGNSIVALVDTDESNKEFWLLGTGQPEKFGEIKGQWAWIVASTDSKLVLFYGDASDSESETTGYAAAYPKTGKLAVYSMVKPQGN